MATAFRRVVSGEPIALLVGLGLIALLVGFVVLPIVQVVTYPSWEDYLQLTQNARWLRAAGNTFRMVVLSTISATLVGFVYAYALARLDLRAGGVLRLIAILPLFSPPFTLGFSYLLMFGRFGLITHGLAGLEISVLGWGSLWAVQTLTNFPYAALAIERILSATPAHLEVAASNLGGGGLAVFRTVTLPLVRPALAGAALLVATYVLADFANPLIIGGDFPLLATEAWYLIDGWGDMGGATLMASTLLPPALCFFVAERFWVGRRRYTVISGRGSALERVPLPWFVRWSLIAFCVTVAAIILSLYFGVIAGAFTETWGVDWTPTFDGVFLAIGYLLVFNRPGIPLGGTAAVLVLAFTFANLPFAYQVLRAGLAQIDQNLADAAADLGASRLRILWDVHLRLVFPACVAAWTTTFVSCMTNLSIAIFLVTPSTQVATFSILGLIGDNRFEAASVLTTALLALTLVAVAATWRLSRGVHLVPEVVRG